MKGRILFVVIGLMLILVGCASTSVHQATATPNAEKVLSASGYSRFDDSARLSVSQRWLSAQQQAKLSAYRELAERLYYEPLAENKTVGSQVMLHEVYRVYLDTYLRAARASDYRTVKDSLKTTLQLKLTPRFYQCMAGNVAQVESCIQDDGKLPFSRLGFQPATIRSVNLACGASDCSDQFHVKGFSKRRSGLDNTLLDHGFYDVEWMANTGLRVLFNYLLIHGFTNAL